MVRKAIRVYGRVQGVSYRYSTEKKAIDLGLVGFVKNIDDGSVYIEAQGEVSKVSELIDWCHDGPPIARVREVKVEECTLKEEPNFKPAY